MAQQHHKGNYIVCSSVPIILKFKSGNVTQVKQDDVRFFLVAQ